MPAAIDLRLYGGDDFAMDLTVTDSAGNAIDLSTSTVTAQIRATPIKDAAAMTSPPLASFGVGIAGNVVSLSLAHAASAGVPARAVWDCQRTDSLGFVTTLAAGLVYMAQQVTP
jgi:hypothetical protein